MTPRQEPDPPEERRGREGGPAEDLLRFAVNTNWDLFQHEPTGDSWGAAERPAGQAGTTQARDRASFGTQPATATRERSTPAGGRGGGGGRRR